MSTLVRVAGIPPFADNPARACHNHPTPWIFYAERDPSNPNVYLRATAQALTVCRGGVRHGPCPIRAECLGWALEHSEFGVWGGTTETHRRGIKRLAREADHV